MLCAQLVFKELTDLKFNITLSADNNNTSSSSANPFKSASSSHQQSQQSANPFQTNPSVNSASTVPTTAVPSNISSVQNIFGSMPSQSNGFATANGISNQLHQQQHSQNFFNYSNGFTQNSSVPSHHQNGTAMLPNGCGFGFGSMQQQISTSSGVPFNNPFAVSFEIY